MRRGKTPFETMTNDSEKLQQAKKLSVWAQNYSTRDNTVGNSLEKFEPKFPSTFDIQGFQSAKVTMAHRIQVPHIAAHKPIFMKDEPTGEGMVSRENSSKIIEVDDLDEFLFEGKGRTIDNS